MESKYPGRYFMLHLNTSEKFQNNTFGRKYLNIALHFVIAFFVFLENILYQSSLLLIRGESEWLLFNTNSSIFQLYHGEYKLIFNEMIMRSGLY